MCGVFFHYHYRTLLPSHFLCHESLLFSNVQHISMLSQKPLFPPTNGQTVKPSLFQFGARAGLHSPPWNTRIHKGFCPPDLDSIVPILDVPFGTVWDVSLTPIRCRIFYVLETKVTFHLILHVYTDQYQRYCKQNRESTEGYSRWKVE